MSSATLGSATPGEGDAAVKRSVAERLFSPWSMGLAAVMLVVSFTLPDDGAGIPLCWLDGAVGLPCPGCGLTRSITNISSLRFVEALRFHPFGFPIYALALGLVAALVSPRLRRRVGAWLDRHDRVAQRLYWTFVTSFVAFGVARLILGLVAPELVDHL